MIRVTVKEAAQKRGINNPKQLADIMGEAHAPIWKVWTLNVTPTLPMLDRICAALSCGLDELITRVPDKRAHTSPARQRGSKKTAVKRKTKAAAG